jgi:hypothetical protein
LLPTIRERPLLAQDQMLATERPQHQRRVLHLFHPLPAWPLLLRSTPWITKRPCSAIKNSKRKNQKKKQINALSNSHARQKWSLSPCASFTSSLLHSLLSHFISTFFFVVQDARDFELEQKAAASQCEKQFRQSLAETADTLLGVRPRSRVRMLIDFVADRASS